MNDSTPAAPDGGHDPWLARGIGDGAMMPAGEASQTVTLAHNCIAMALKERTARGSEAPQHSAALFDEGTAQAAPVIRHSLSTEHPEALVLDACAQAAIPTAGKSLYLTHHPLEDGAASIIAAGIGKLYIDYQPLDGLAPATAQSLWKAHEALERSDVAVAFIDVPKNRHPIEEIRHAAMGGTPDTSYLHTQGAQASPLSPGTAPER